MVARRAAEDEGAGLGTCGGERADDNGGDVLQSSTKSQGR